MQTQQSAKQGRKCDVSYQVLQLIERQHVQPVLSTALLFEYEEVLRRNQRSLQLSQRAIDQILDGLCARSDIQHVYFLWRPHLSDPKDDHVLELAVAAGSVDIVTHNLRHFRQANTFGVRVMNPAELLGEIK